MNLLGMFAKHPVPGETKTRLAASIGFEAAAALSAAFVEDLLARCSLLADEFIIAATPLNADATAWFSERIDGSTKLLFQPSGSLGERVHWFFQEAKRRGAERAVLIGSDSPDLPSMTISRAFQRLDFVDMVLVPAMDGGFVLVGLRQPVEGLFDLIHWSSGATLVETIKRASAQGLRVELLAPWYDVDTVNNLGVLLPLQAAPESGAAICPRTQAVLDGLAQKILEGLINS